MEIGGMLDEAAPHADGRPSVTMTTMVEWAGRVKN